MEPIRTPDVGHSGIKADDQGDPAGKNRAGSTRPSYGPLATSRCRSLRPSAKGLDCYCGSPGEVRNCIITKCVLWPFRAGSNSWRAKKTPKQQAAAFATLGENPRNVRRIPIADGSAGVSCYRRSS
jgi:hypothetical protein